ncbi:hypothetical protein X797_009307 [Metarhizium robertsii]|uniref:Uncharacterized protein n=1 Tax=Metarhizium robertsii TaxID=568076 RepID=A0A014QV66_9HYPO|nr:hypothetical protein X797_009307 [Metarhizium robertsii]
MTQTCMSSQSNGSTENSCLGYTYSLSHGYHNVTARTDSRARSSLHKGSKMSEALGVCALGRQPLSFQPP